MTTNKHKGIFRRYDCPSCRPLVYRRGEGLCPKCGTALVKGPLCIQYLVRGKRKTEVCEQNNLRYAEALLEKRRQQHRDGVALPSRKTWLEVAQEWLDLSASQHADKGARARYAVERLKPHFEKIPIGEIRRADLLEYILKRGRAVKQATVAKEVRTFKQIWRHAKNSEYVGNSPFDGVQVAEGLPPIKAPLTRAEEERLLAALPKSSLPLFQFMALTGARGKEARYILKKDVDLKRGLVWVKGKNRKGDSERHPIVLCNDAKTLVLEAMKTPSEWLFPNLRVKDETEIKPYADIKSSFRRAVESARLIKKVKGPHDLRHLFVSRLVQAGVDHVTVATLSRHKDLRMLQRYAHLAPNQLREALEKAKKNRK